MAKDKENGENIHCPRCGGELRKIGIETVGKISGIIGHDTYCDKCNITVNIEDRSAFRQDGNILIVFA